MFSIKVFDNLNSEPRCKLKKPVSSFVNFRLSSFELNLISVSSIVSLEENIVIPCVIALAKLSTKSLFVIDIEESYMLIKLACALFD